MTRDSAIQLILARCGGRQSDAVLQALAITEMQFAQEELERGEKPTLPWFLKSEYVDAAFKTLTSTPNVAVPTGFLREQDDVRVALFYQDVSLDDDWVPLTKVDFDEGKTELGGSAPGKPEAYTLHGENYRFWPDPDAEYPLKALIFVADAVLTGNTENKWLKYAGKLLMGKTGEVITGLHIRDEAARALFANMSALGAEAFTRADVARDEAGRSRSQGEE
jgi:hypothetical protein